MSFNVITKLSKKNFVRTKVDMKLLTIMNHIINIFSIIETFILFYF